MNKLCNKCLCNVVERSCFLLQKKKKGVGAGVSASAIPSPAHARLTRELKSQIPDDLRSKTRVRTGDYSFGAQRKRVWVKHLAPRGANPANARLSAPAQQADGSGPVQSTVATGATLSPDIATLADPFTDFI